MRVLWMPGKDAVDGFQSCRYSARVRRNLSKQRLYSYSVLRADQYHNRCQGVMYVQLRRDCATRQKGTTLRSYLNLHGAGPNPPVLSLSLMMTAAGHELAG
jgi:hypothetical protein